jgi:hypothetical protein
MNELLVSDKLKANYDAYYDGESEWRAIGAKEKVKNIVDACSGIPHDSILEIGSGDGAILNGLADAKFGTNLFSLEISASAVATIARRKIANLRECRIFNGYDIPYTTGQFDLAIVSHVLEHAEHPRKLLYEASRAAAFVFIEVPLEDTIRLKSDFVFSSVGHINYYTWRTIRLLVQSCELQVLSQVITNPSRSAYEYRSGRIGLAKHALRQALLRCSQSLACELFTYHCSILCATPRQNQASC